MRRKRLTARNKVAAALRKRKLNTGFNRLYPDYRFRRRSTQLL